MEDFCYLDPDGAKHQGVRTPPPYPHEKMVGLVLRYELEGGGGGVDGMVPRRSITCCRYFK